MTDVTDVIIKSMTEINNQEYILYNWMPVTAVSDEIPVMLRGRMRTPAEAKVARDEFDVFVEAYRALYPRQPEKIEIHEM